MVKNFLAKKKNLETIGIKKFYSYLTKNYSMYQWKYDNSFENFIIK